MKHNPVKPIYLDHHATTPLDPRVLEAMLPYFIDNFGNASSIDHEYGAVASKAVDDARIAVAKAIGAKTSEIVFTSGATESDNLAIIGAAQTLESKGKHVITCVTEHSAVLDTCKYLETQGWDVTYLPVDRYGIIDPDDVRRAIRPDTTLISVMAANNEIGTLGPISHIGHIAHEADVLFHTDASQAIGRIPIDVNAMNIDILSISAHKIYGPKGSGALFVRRNHPRVKILAQSHGGGHEYGLRSGTLNVPGIVGLGKAVEIAVYEMESECARLQELRDRLLDQLANRIPGIELNGHPTIRLCNNLNIYIPGVQNRALLVQLRPNLAISTGSACTTMKIEPSHVLLAIGLSEQSVHQCIRFGLGRGSSSDEINAASDAFISAVTRLQRLV